MTNDIFDIFVQFELVHPDARRPNYAHSGDSGADIFACGEVCIPPLETCVIRTGVKISLPDGYEAQLRSKSGLALQGVHVLNSPGTIDCGYRGEILVILHNSNSQLEHNVLVGDKVGQLVIAPVVQAHFLEVKQVEGGTDRGEKGFGSTGR